MDRDILGLGPRTADRCEYDTGDFVPVHDRINCAHSFHHVNASIDCHLADRCIKFKAWSRTSVIRKIATGPRKVQLLAKTSSTQSLISGATFKPGT
jgi:hypothetical protein